MRSVVEFVGRRALHAALCIPLLLSACGRTTTDCCLDDYGASYALIYGVVRYPDGSGVVGAEVRSTYAGHSVTTANGGVYRLPIPLPMLAPGSLQTSVNVIPPNYRPGVDSVTRISITVQSFETERVGDSTRVDVTLIGTP